MPREERRTWEEKQRGTQTETRTETWTYSCSVRGICCEIRRGCGYPNHYEIRCGPETYCGPENCCGPEIHCEIPRGYAIASQTVSENPTSSEDGIWRDESPTSCEAGTWGEPETDHHRNPARYRSSIQTCLF